MSKSTWMTLVLIGLASLFGVRNIQDDLESKTLRALAAAEITDVEVTASGFDVRLIGTVDQEEKLALVGRLALVVREDVERRALSLLEAGLAQGLQQ